MWREQARCVHSNPPETAREYSACQQLRCAAAGNCPGEAQYCASHHEAHEVGCCADSPVDGFQQLNPDTCSDVWGERDAADLSCQDALNYPDAVAFCVSMGGRLCTADELERNCNAGTGCDFNNNLIWSSTAGDSPADSTLNAVSHVERSGLAGSAVGQWLKIDLGSVQTVAGAVSRHPREPPTRQ